MTTSIEQQVAHFKTLSREEQLAKVKGMLSILWEDVVEMRGLRDTVNTFGEEVSQQDLVQIFESILSLVQEYQQQEQVDAVLSPNLPH